MTTIKEILYVLLDNYAEHEIGFLPEAVNTDEQGFRKERKYANKIVAPTLGPVKSIGGMRTLPDYSFESMPEDYAALVLIGGYGWMTAEADGVVPIVKQALSKGIIVEIRLTYAHFFRNFRLLLSQNKTKAWKITS